MILLITLSIIFIYLFDLFYWKRRNLPPGPLPLPLLGNLYLMTEDVRPGYKMYQKLRLFTFVCFSLDCEFNSVFEIVIGQVLPGGLAAVGGVNRLVMITDWKLIKQHFIKDGGNFVGRPEFPISIEMRKGPYGILESHGNRWSQHRRFALHVLKDFGLGKNLMEEKVLIEVQSMIDTIKKSMKDADMQNVFDASVGSVINNLLFGYRYDETNMAEFLELKDRLRKHFKMSGEPLGALVGMYPWLGHFPIFKGFKNVVMDNWAHLMKTFRKQAEEKLATIDYDSNEYSDYVEAFLKERKKHEHEEGYGGYEMEQLDSVCFDLWVAGMETTSNTLYWSLLYVLFNPNVLQKIYEELDSKIGSDRIITTSDRNHLNYINATINESQRLANLLPMNLSRTTTADVEIGGYRIPKNTVITPQISSVMYDPLIFPEPYEFRPERFIDSTDGSLKKVEELVPFSIGKRQCLGEGLAKMELFLFFSNLFNKFVIKLHSDNLNASVKKDMRLTMKARNYQVVMKERY